LRERIKYSYSFLTCMMYKIHGASVDLTVQKCGFYSNDDKRVYKVLPVDDLVKRIEGIKRDFAVITLRTMRDNALKHLEIPQSEDAKETIDNTVKFADTVLQALGGN